MTLSQYNRKLKDINNEQTRMLRPNKVKRFPHRLRKFYIDDIKSRYKTMRENLKYEFKRRQKLKDN